MAEEWIAKKDLLDETGISYGQLYRWKREGLIPEGWFVKRSSFTGQETFFPRRKMLARIHNILKLKDQMSLEELARRLSPEMTSRLYPVDAVRECREIDPEVLMVWGLERGAFQFSFQDVVLMAALSLYRAQEPSDLEGLKTLVRHASPMAEALKGEISHDFKVLRAEDGPPLLLIEREIAPAMLDGRLRAVFQCSLTNLADSIKAQYGKMVTEQLPVEEGEA